MKSLFLFFAKKLLPVSTCFEQYVTVLLGFCKNRSNIVQASILELGNRTQILITLCRWWYWDCYNCNMFITFGLYNELEILGNLTGSIMDVSDPHTSWWTKCLTSS